MTISIQGNGFELGYLYPTPLYQAQEPRAASVGREIGSKLAQIQFTSGPRDWGRTHKISDIPGQALFDSDHVGLLALSETDQMLTRHVEQYCRALNIPLRPYRRTSWFTRFDHGDFGALHNHMNADISGCYYVRTNGRDGSINFRSPNPYFGVSPCYFDLGQNTAVPPKEGLILLFPGWLEHGIQANTTENIRISLSFNIFFK